jgi:peptide/nickel transport system ATP-binding protein
MAETDTPTSVADLTDEPQPHEVHEAHHSWTLWPLLVVCGLFVLNTLPAGAVLVVLGIIAVNFIPIAIGLVLAGLGWVVLRMAIRTFRWSTEAVESLLGLFAALAVGFLVFAFFAISGDVGFAGFGPFVFFVLAAVLAFLHLRSGDVPPMPEPQPVTPLDPATHGSQVSDATDLTMTVSHLTVEFPVGRTGLKVQAVTDVSFDVRRGETLGLVGESGCGKSTTGRAVLQFPRPTSGEIWFDGQELTSLSGEQMRAMRPRIQMIFQDPISSLNPRHTIGDIVGEPLKVWNRGTPKDRAQLVADTLETVGLDPDVAMGKRPHEFSGGQCQRISIARALVMEPDLIICDEPVSALDVSVQAQILNLLEDLKARYGLTLIFIAHDLAVVKNVSDRVAVMYLGRLVEVARPDDLYRQPAHHYTSALLRSIPEPDPSAESTAAGVMGEIPSPVAPPSGCRFRTRCPRAEERCAAEVPIMREVAPGHHVACHFPLVGPEAEPVSEVPVAAPAG